MRIGSTLAAGAAALLVATAAPAATILETATLGPTGQTGGLALNDQYLGARFEITEPTQITAIGGHFSRRAGSLFAAIVELSSAGALPGFADPMDIDAPGNAIFGQSFELPATLTSSADVLIPVSFTLDPGFYALIFGGDGDGVDGPFGATGFGAMPENNTNIGSPSYFVGLSAGFWENGGFSNTRFVVEGEPIDGVVPLPAGAVLLLTGLAGIALLGRRRA